MTSLLVLLDRTAPVDDRAEAALAMGRLQDPRAIVPLIYAVRDPEERVQLAVIQALGQFTHLGVERTLADVLADAGRMVTVQAAAAYALGSQRTASARTALYAVFQQSRQPQPVRRACGEALETFFPGYLASLGESAHAVDRRGRALLVPASCGFGAYALGTIGQYGKSQVAVPIGMLSGLVLGGAGSFLLTQDAEMTMARAGGIVTGGAWGLWTGLTAGRMATHARPDEELVNTLGLAGEALGLVATSLAARHNRYTFNDIVTINLGALAGHNALWGGLLLASNATDTPQALGALMGASLVSLAGTAAATPRLHFTGGDVALITHGALQGAWIGTWVPALGRSRPSGDQVWGGMLLGSSLGTLGSAVVSQYVDLETKHTAFMATTGGYGYLLGAGLPKLLGVDEPRWTVGTMLGVGIAGTVVGAWARDIVVFDRGDAALTALGTAWGGWQGLSIGAYLDANPNFDFDETQRSGAMMTGAAVGGIATLGVAQVTDVTAWETLMLASGGMWGSWLSLWGNALADSEPRVTWLSNIVASNLGLAATAVLMSPVMKVHPTRVGIVDLAGMSGAALASLGAALVTDDSDTIITANLVGSGAGLLAGVIVASKVDVKAAHARRWRRWRPARTLARWEPSISLLPLFPPMGEATGRPGWYVSLSAREPVR